MNIKPDCLSCLFDQALRVTKLLKLDDATSKEVFDKTAQVLIEHTMSSTPPQIAKDIYQAISDVTGEKDPVALAKEQATKEALKIDTSRIHTIPDVLKMAVIGNVIDFGSQKQFDLNQMILYHLHRTFAIDHTLEFMEELQHAKEMVLIGDNVGEHIFDKLLIESIKKIYDITVHYFVRGTPIINDVTIKEGQLLKDCAHIVDTGVKTPGFDLEEANSASKEIFDRADIVLAKGMGNFESLYHVANRPIYYLFVVKCSVVAEEIGHNIKDLIFKKS
ncbi:ARMT1-like domain-containing protein [Sulfurovum sp. XTW-4]|uniref:ARMT1-like domain-containing protein n=1 Tax=Sulfurovum xiamenensis TaxID=3019066 RepID=A0ABT7QT29_9BACT|nr:ARMT1-like domain-containing protein [Sulfurovum xiamenensis]MDM5264242.1 ARMT1-like domain-containing protein [Sulfurovum xiamenensis]